MKILIVGLGSIAQKHVSAIRNILYEPNIIALRSKENSNIFPGIKNIYSIDELDAKPDFIIISNPTSLHAETIKNALSIGCPLFIEKPVLQDLNALEILNKSIHEKNIVTYVACNLRFHPVIQYLHKYLKENNELINEVNIYCGSYLPDWRPERDFRTIYSAKTEMGGGVHLDLIHELDYCFWLFGKPAEVISLKRNVSSLRIDAVDFAQYNFLYKSFSANIVLNYYRRDVRRDIEIVLENGTIKADLIWPCVINVKTKEILYQKEFSIQDTYLIQMKYFIDHLKLHQKPMNDFFEATEILKTVLT